MELAVAVVVECKMTLRDLITNLRATRADMLGTPDEQHYWDCQRAANFIEYVFESLPMLETALADLTTAFEEIEKSKDDDTCEKS